MSLYRVATLSLTLLTLALSPGGIECGPVRSMALVAQRSSKIPISIRAPFKHSETMIARGYGKRASHNTMQFSNGPRQNNLPIGFGKRLSLNQANVDYPSDSGTSWDFGKKETNFLEGNLSEGQSENIERFENDLNQSESVPIDWVVNELTNNPSLLKAILYRFLDTNKDERLTPQEFLGINGESHTDSA